MLDGLVRAAALGLGHVEVVVWVRSVSDQLGQELQSVDLVDRVAEVLDAAGEVEDDHQSRVDLVGCVSGKTRPLGIERCAQLTELRRQPLSLATGVGFGQARHVPGRLCGPIYHRWRPERQERPALRGHPAA